MNFKLEGVQNVLNNLAKAEGEIVREVDAVLKNGAEEIASQAKVLAPIYLGELKNKIAYKEIGKLRYEIAANAYHAPYIEFGTGPKTKVPAELEDVAREVKARKKRKGTLPEFVRALLLWGKKKGYFDDEGSAYMAAIKILKNGMKPQPFLYPSFVQKRKMIIQDIRNVIDEKSG